jgi:hypothetical protein
VQMVFLVVDSSTGDLAHSRSATRRQLKITGYCSRLLKHALVHDADIMAARPLLWDQCRLTVEHWAPPPSTP